MESYVKVSGVKNFSKSSTAMGLDLTELQTVPRQTSGVEISCETFGENWFITESGRALFKTYSSDEYYDLQNLRMINELICAKICKQIDLPCADYEPAHIRHGKRLQYQTNGIISHNFLQEGEKLISLCTLMGNPYHGNLRHLSSILTEKQRQNYNLSPKEIILNLYKMIVFDYITLQCDRHSRNINLVLKSSQYRTSKLIDNEFAFCIQYFSGLKMFSNFQDFKKVLAYYSQNAKMLTIEETTPSKKREHFVAKDIVDYARANPEMMSELKHILKNIDIDSAIDEVELGGTKISEAYKFYMKQVVAYTTQNLEKLLRTNSISLDTELIEPLY